MDTVPPLLSSLPWFFADSVSSLAWADAQIATMQQRIDHLALLNEKQAASSQEPSELEELRGKNERYASPCHPSSIQSLLAGWGPHPSHSSSPGSLTVRLHETLKQCQNLKTEKNQMDRKITQLSEENGDLSFKVSGWLAVHRGHSGLR